MTNAELYKLINMTNAKLDFLNDKLDRLIDELWADKMHSIKDNSIKEYLDTLAFDEVADKSVSRVYELYVEWCATKNYPPVNNRAFGRAVCKTFDVKSVNCYNCGNPMRIYRWLGVN